MGLRNELLAQGYEEKENRVGIITRDELLAMGCEEVTSPKGRKTFKIGEDIRAIECTKCMSLKEIRMFGKHAIGFMGIRSNCKECNNEQSVKWAAENPEHTFSYGRHYRKKNKEKLRKKNHKHYIENRKHYNEKSRKNREDNLERYREYGRRYYRKNRGLYRLQGQIRKARKLALPNDLTKGKLAEINASFYNTCALSGEPTDLHLDHVIPVSVGHGGTTYGNMIPLNGTLNTSKNDRHIFEWFDDNHERFGLSRDKFDALIEYLAKANEMTTQEYRKYVDWCFDNPRVICETTGELVFKDGVINERMTKI